MNTSEIKIIGYAQKWAKDDEASWTTVPLGIEHLMNMGGLIEQMIVDKLVRKFGHSVVESVITEYRDSAAVCEMLDLTALLYRAIFGEYSNVYTQEDDSDYKGKERRIDRLNRFSKWFLDQNLRCLELRTQEGTLPVFLELGNKSRLRRFASYVLPVEDRVIALTIGKINGERFTPGQIAALPEFDCETAWIERILEGVTETLKDDERALDEYKDLGGVIIIEDKPDDDTGGGTTGEEEFDIHRQLFEEGFR